MPVIQELRFCGLSSNQKVRRTLTGAFGGGKLPGCISGFQFNPAAFSRQCLSSLTYPQRACLNSHLGSTFLKAKGRKKIKNKRTDANAEGKWDSSQQAAGKEVIRINSYPLTTQCAASTVTVTQIAPNSALSSSPFGNSKWQNEEKGESRDVLKQMSRLPCPSAM